MDSLTWQQWLESRNIDIDTMTVELEAALQSQYEADCAPIAEVLVSSADCPAKVYRIATQPTLFDMRAAYQ